jgi:hypothetical protein
VAIAFQESGSRDVVKRLRSIDRLISSNLLEAELRSALVREGVASDASELLSWVSWVYPDRPLTDEFREVLAHGHARGADLWHLGAALYLRSSLGEIGFATLDQRQVDLAAALGFTIDVEPGTRTGRRTKSR